MVLWANKIVITVKLSSIVIDGKKLKKSYFVDIFIDIRIDKCDRMTTIYMYLYCYKEIINNLF